MCVMFQENSFLTCSVSSRTVYAKTDCEDSSGVLVRALCFRIMRTSVTGNPAQLPVTAGRSGLLCFRPRYT